MLDATSISVVYLGSFLEEWNRWFALRWDNNLDSYMNVLCLRPFDSKCQVSVDWCRSTLSVLLPWRSVWQHCSQVCETRQAKTHLRIQGVLILTHTHRPARLILTHFQEISSFLSNVWTHRQDVLLDERLNERRKIHVSVMLPCPTWIPLLIDTWLTGRRRNPAFILPGFSSALKEVSAKKTGLGFVKEKRIELPLQHLTEEIRRVSFSYWVDSSSFTARTPGTVTQCMWS